MCFFVFVLITAVKINQVEKYSLSEKPSNKNIKTE